MEKKKLDRIINFIREEMMTTGSTAGKPGFSSKADAEGPTAGFDPKSRTLILPIMKEMEGEVYDLFVCHEVGHALHTPAEGWHNVSSKNGQHYKGFLNIVEDARIEKKVKKR